MALDGGTPETNWPAAPSSSALVAGFNRIEENIQSLEDTKIENLSGEVDLTAGGADADVVLELDSSYGMTWDESEDEFVIDAAVSGAVRGWTYGTEFSVSITPSTPYIVPEGFWLIMPRNIRFDIELLVDGAWKKVGESDGGDLNANAIVSDGVSLRYTVDVTSGSYPLYLQRLA
jgi:hypothetical protein